MHRKGEPKTVKGRHHLEEMSVEGRTVLGWMFKTCGLDSSGSGQGNEPSSSVNVGGCLNWLSDYQLLNKSSVPWHCLPY
jgi:hypothetical protein